MNKIDSDIVLSDFIEDEEDDGDGDGLVPIIEEDTIIEGLITEFATQRNSLKEMINDLDQIKIKINTLFPDALDKRYVRFFEEKMKAMTSLFGTILDIKKEIMKGLKTEIDMRKAIKAGDDDDDILEQFDMTQMADKIKKLKEENEKQKKKRIELRTKGEEHVRIS